MIGCYIVIYPVVFGIPGLEVASHHAVSGGRRETVLARRSAGSRTALWLRDKGIMLLCLSSRQRWLRDKGV